MKFRHLTQSVLKWLPSFIIAFIFIQNGTEKICDADELDKIIKSPILIRGVGITLILSTILFLYPKTALWGASILALYMSFIVCVHLYKGKPFEVTALIVISIIFATHLRQPKLLSIHEKI